MVDPKERDSVLMHYGVLGMKWGVRKSRQNGSRRRQSTSDKAAQRSEARRRKILSSPSRLYRNRDLFTQAEIDAAMKRMKWERELRSLSKDERERGSAYINSIMSYAEAANKVYTFSQSRLAKRIWSGRKKA